MKALDAALAIGGAILALFGLSKTVRGNSEDTNADKGPLPVSTDITKVSPFISETPNQIPNGLSASRVRPSGLKGTFYDVGKRVGIDWRLLYAVAKVESGLNQTAKNPADPSYGLMQIRCVAAGPDAQCTNVKRIPQWDEATPNRLLLDAAYNVQCGAYILKWNIKAFSYPRGVACYNDWGSRLNPVYGPFDNAEYVRKVDTEYQRLLGEGGLPPVAWGTKTPLL